MKQSLIIIVLIFFATHLFGQANFLVEDKIVNVGSMNKTYNFGYQYKDSISLYFMDSAVEFINPTKTIIKETSYSIMDSKSNTRIQYLKTNGEDSVEKHFKGENLNTVYETKLDSIGRIVYYAMKDFMDDNKTFVWTYEYNDSIISTGKIEIQTVFVNDTYGNKQFHYRVLSEYNQKHKKVKETRQSEIKDTMPLITAYKYDRNNRLISKSVDGIENILPIKHVNTTCDIELEEVLTVSNFKEVNNLVKQLLLKNKKMLTTDKCKNYRCKYISPDKQNTLVIVKREPYWCGGKTVTFTMSKGND
ncbi:MAG: hypothetical protein V4643_11095 [Bacteroidota bacterium]